MRYFALLAIVMIFAAPHALRADEASSSAPPQPEARPQEVIPMTDLSTPEGADAPPVENGSLPVDNNGSEVNGDHVTHDPKVPVDTPAQKDPDPK